MSHPPWRKPWQALSDVSERTSLQIVLTTHLMQPLVLSVDGVHPSTNSLSLSLSLNTKLAALCRPGLSPPARQRAANFVFGEKRSCTACLARPQRCAWRCAASM